jgi:hypothetical protein
MSYQANVMLLSLTVTAILRQSVWPSLDTTRLLHMDRDQLPWMSASSFTGLHLEEHNLTSLTQCLLTNIAVVRNNRDNFPNPKT